MPRRDHPRHDAALHYVAAEPSLHRRHPRKATSCVGWTEEGRRHRGTQHLGPAAMVETGRVAASRAARLTANRHGGLREFEVSRQGLVDVRFCAAGSTGRRNTSVKSLCWGFKLQGLTWSFV